jgi:hypothetical protein
LQWSVFRGFLKLLKMPISAEAAYHNDVA